MRSRNFFGYTSPRFKPLTVTDFWPWNGRRFVDDPSHQYEDPSKLADEVFHSQGRGRPHPPSRPGDKRPRRKTNEAYEPVPYSQKRKRTFTDDSDDGYHRDTCNKLFKVMAFFGFLFGLGAAVVVVMLMLGIMFVPGCDDCKKEIVPSQSSTAQSVGSAQELWRVIKEMKSNLSELNQAIRKKNEIISQLQRRDIEHTGKIVELEQRAAEAFYSNSVPHREAIKSSISSQRVYIYLIGSIYDLCGQPGLHAAQITDRYANAITTQTLTPVLRRSPIIRRRTFSTGQVYRANYRVHY